MEPEARADRSILAIRESVTFVADPGRGMESASLEVQFADGSREGISVDAFRGSTANPMSDGDLLREARRLRCGRDRSGSNRGRSSRRSSLVQT